MFCNFFNTLFVFFVILFRTWLLKFKSIKLKCYFITLLYTIVVNMIFLEFSSKKGCFFLIIPSIPVSLNQYCGEIGSFYNQSSSQITELPISLFNILVNFPKNVLVYVILIVNMIFSMLLDQFSSCNIICLWNFMKHLVSFRLLTSFLAKFSGKIDLLVEILNRVQVQGLTPFEASQFAIGIAIAHRPIIFTKFLI